jgi:hypothetical protein
MFPICNPHPNWMPKKPKDMFQICQNVRRGFSVMVVGFWKTDEGSRVSHVVSNLAV